MSEKCQCCERPARFRFELGWVVTELAETQDFVSQEILKSIYVCEEHESWPETQMIFFGGVKIQGDYAIPKRWIKGAKA